MKYVPCVLVRLRRVGARRDWTSLASPSTRLPKIRILVRPSVQEGPDRLAAESLGSFAPAFSQGPKQFEREAWQQNVRSTPPLCLEFRTLGNEAWVLQGMLVVPVVASKSNLKWRIFALQRITHCGDLACNQTFLKSNFRLRCCQKARPID